jgi:hypothetical protein
MHILVFVLFALGTALVPDVASATTYHVNAATGDDTRTAGQAQVPSTPWKTIKRGVDIAQPGDTVIVAPGTYAESVESKRDGTPVLPIVVKASSPAPNATKVQPAAGADNGFFISHNYNTVDGFTVIGGAQPIKLGPHDGGSGPVVGLLIQNNTVSLGTSNGIKVSKGLNVEIAFNTVFENGGSGINHAGNGSLIHDNVVHHNSGFGIYVKDGAGHQVYDNASFSNGQANLQIVGDTIPSPAFTYYVHCATGDDARTATQAKNQATPWRTVKFALSVVDAGDTVVILGGTPQSPQVCAETTIESRKDGSPGAPITIQAATRDAVVFDPPAGNGFFISHDYHTLIGIAVTGAVKGIQLGPHDGGGGPVNGLILNRVRVSGNSQTGVEFNNGAGGVVKHSVISDNGSHGISYAGTSANIFNNLVYGNGGGGDYGITLSSGSGHRVANNTLFGNLSGGLRLGTAAGSAVSAVALNNVIVGSPVGIKEQGISASTLNFNNVFANTANYQLTLSGQGANSFSEDPRFVDASGSDFRLSRVATGQAANSPCIDAGSGSSEALNLEGRTAFTDKSADIGIVDLGYHGTLLDPTEGAVTVNTASITFNQSPPAGNDSFTLSVRLAPGAGSDGIDVGNEYAEVSFGAFFYSLPVTGFQFQGGNVWTFSASGASGTFTRNANGSVDMSLQVTGLNLAYSDSPIFIGARIGDDFGSSQVGLAGTIRFP